jgi:hypothetical protein
MHTPLKHHLLEFHKRHVIEHTAFAQEYGTDGFGVSEDKFPHSAPDVMAVIAICFDYARRVLDAALTERAHQVGEECVAPSTEHVASVAAMPWIALLKEVDRAHTAFTRQLRAVNEELLHSTAPSNPWNRAPVSLSYLPFNAYMEWSPHSFAESHEWTIGTRIVYLTTSQPALLRACYVWNCGNPDLALRMFACACDRVESYDEFHGLAIRMRYTLAQMYRRNKRYIEAIKELQQVVAMDGTFQGLREGNSNLEGMVNTTR